MSVRKKREAQAYQSWGLLKGAAERISSTFEVVCVTIWQRASSALSLLLCIAQHISKLKCLKFDCVHMENI